MADIAELVQRYASVGLVLILVLGPVVFFQIRMARRRLQEIARHRAEGTIGPAGFLQGERLPIHYDTLAQLGTTGDAPRTVDDRVLRASVGVRVLVIGLVLTVGNALYGQGTMAAGIDEALRELPIPPVVARSVLAFAAVSALVYIFGFEARYNRDLLVVTRMLVLRREYRWRDLEWIGDDGAYDLVLSFGPRGKARVLKHSRGIAEFRRFAQAVLAKHKEAHARTARG